MNFESEKAAVEAFVAGATEGVSGLVTIAGSALSRGDACIARRAGTDRFLLAVNVLPPEINDALIIAIIKAGKTFERITDFTTLPSASARVADLDNARYSQFETIAAIFGFSYTKEELASLEAAKDFKEKTRAFFSEIEAAERAERQRIADATKTEAERLANEKWDRGEGQNRNGIVSGAGGGLRLRAVKNSTRTNVFTSGGEYTTLGVVKKAWDFAVPYWYEGKEFQSGGRSSKKVSSGNYYNSGRIAEVGKDYIKIGCQTVKRLEAERFADLQGWSRTSA